MPAADWQDSRALTIIDYIPAGRQATNPVMPGTSIKIMTGAPLTDQPDQGQTKLKFRVWSSGGQI